ncbi:hypothetical protein [Streptomyces sp. NPDC087859]
MTATTAVSGAAGRRRGVGDDRLGVTAAVRPDAVRGQAVSSGA